MIKLLFNLRSLGYLDWTYLIKFRVPPPPVITSTRQRGEGGDNISNINCSKKRRVHDAYGKPSTRLSLDVKSEKPLL